MASRLGAPRSDARTAQREAGPGSAVSTDDRGPRPHRLPETTMRSILFGTLLALTLAPNPSAQNRDIELPWLRTAGATGEGVAADDRAGWSVSGAGDFDGDGFDDLIIGAPEDFLGAGDVRGNAYIVLGSATITGSIDLAAAAVVMTGGANDDEAGYSVSGAGDVNDDGFDDVIVGAWHSDPNGSNSGRAYILYGSATPACRSRAPAT